MATSDAETPGENLANLFELLWIRSPEPPDPAAFLQAHPVASLRDRAEVVRVDQRRRWKLGRPRPLSEYFRDHPELAAHPAIKAALAAAEYKTASRHGHAPELETFLAEFPDLPALRDRLAPPPTVVPPAGDDIYHLAPSDADATGLGQGNDRAGDAELGLLLPEAHELLAAVSPLVRPANPMADVIDPAPSRRPPPKNWAGRRLVARARQWNDDPSLGSLPWVWEWVAILAMTRRADWTKKQKAVMVAGTKFQVALALILLVTGAITSWGYGLVVSYRSLGEFGPEIAVNDPAAVRLYAGQLKAASTDFTPEGRQGRLDAVPNELRGWEWSHLRVPEPIPPLTPRNARSTASILFNVDGDSLAIVGTTQQSSSSSKEPPKIRGAVWVVRLPNGEPVHVIDSEPPIARVAFSREGGRVAAVHPDGSVSVGGLGQATSARLEAPAAENARAVDLAFDPRSRKVLVATAEGQIRAWDPADPGPAQVVGESHPGAVRLATTPDGFRLATAGGGRFTLWDTASKAKLVEAGKENEATPPNLALSPDGSLIAALTTEGIGVWNVEDGRRVARWDSAIHGPDRLAFDPTSKRLASAAPDGVRIRDVASGRDVLTLSAPGVSWGEQGGISFRPDGQRLSAAGRVWDLDDGRPVGNPNRAVSPLFAPRGAYSASTSSNAVLIDEAGRMEPSSQLGSAGAISADGKTLVTVNPGNSLTDIDSGTRSFEMGMIGIRYSEAAAWRPDGRRFATYDREGEIRLWDARSVTPIKTIRLRSVESLLYTQDSKRLIAVLSRGNGVAENADLGALRGLAFFDGETGEETHAFVGGYYLIGARVAASPNGRLLASGCVHKTVRIYDIRSGWIRRTLEGHTGSPVDVAFSPNSRLLASCCIAEKDGQPIAEGGETILWDVRGGTVAHILPGAAFGVAFSPDGRRLATAGEREVTIWDVSTGLKLFTLTAIGGKRPWKSLTTYNFSGTGVPSTGVWALPITFSADGRRLLLTGRNFRDGDWQRGDNLPITTTVWRSIDPGEGSSKAPQVAGGDQK